METVTLKKEIPTEVFIRDFVDIPRFRECCSKCPGYGKRWACPPYDFDSMEIWRSCSSVLLYAKKLCIPAEERGRIYSPDELKRAYNSLLAPVRAELMEELYALEREHPGSRALSAGGCEVCRECTRGAGKPCARPDLMRYSVESLGGDVLKCIGTFLGESVEWAGDGRLPGKYILLGALLIP